MQETKETKQDREERILAKSFMSYNLVNSLYTIKGIAESHLEHMRRKEKKASQEELIKEVRQVLGETMAQINRVIEMIRHLREMSEVSDIEGVPSRVSLHDSITFVLRAMQYEYPLRRITLLKILPHDLGPLAVSRDHLETILFGLLFHARQQLRGGLGLITIEGEEKFYPSKENRKMRRVAVRISHTGPAIPEKELPFIFDPFYTKPGRRGVNGFGLYLVKRLVELNEGTIRVETGETATSFHVELPG